MIKADIVNRVAERSDVSRVKAAVAVDTIFDALKSALGEGKRIELRGFGVFLVKDRKRGIGRNPKTGVEVAIAPGKTVRFKPGATISDSAGVKRRGAARPAGCRRARGSGPRSPSGCGAGRRSRSACWWC